MEPCELKDEENLDKDYGSILGLEDAEPIGFF